MKTIFFWLAVFFALGFNLSAQQEGSVEIAKAIRPNEEINLSSFSGCVERLNAVGLSPKESAKECKEAAKLVVKNSTRIANEAADATKASRPVVVSNCCGWGGGWGNTVVYTPYYRYNSPPRTPPPPRTVQPRTPPPPRN